MITTRYGIEVDLSYEHKTTCPYCRVKLGRDNSGDNLHVYPPDEDGRHGGAYCFSCNYKIPSVKWLEENAPINIEDMEYTLVGSEFNEEVHNGIKSITTFNKEYRGVKPDTSKYFGVRYECSQETGEVVSSYYPITKGVMEGVAISDAITGYKIRKHPKGFSAVGDVGNDSDLFMQFRFTTHKGILVLAAGEVDALSAYQILKNDYNKRGNNRYDEVAVVSGVTGEGGVKNIQKHYEFFIRQ